MNVSEWTGVLKQVLGHVDLFMAAPFYLGYVWAAGRFCRSYLGGVRKKEVLFVGISFGSWLLWNLAGSLYPGILFFSVVPGPVFFVALVLLFGGGKEKRILAASLLMLIFRLTAGFCNALLSCLALFFRHRVQKIPEPIFRAWEMGLIGCVGCCFALLAVFWMRKRMGSVFRGKPGKWYWLLALPLLLLTAVFDMAEWGASNGVVVRSGGNMGLYYDQIFSNMEFLGLTVLSLAATGFYVFGMNRIYLEQQKSSRYHSQVAVYKMLAEQYSQSERLRHDMKNHIIALSGLFADQEWEKMGDYLNRLEENALEAGGDVTGNQAVDALLYQKRKRAEQEKIRWECDVQIPKGCSKGMDAAEAKDADEEMDSFDLCVLFGNLLDNALEACGRMRPCQGRFIRIQAGTVKKCFLLEVKNSMDSVEKAARALSGKGDAPKPGIGLLNVDDVVRRYNGAMHTEIENGTFLISILIPLSGAAHDSKQAV